MCAALSNAFQSSWLLTWHPPTNQRARSMSIFHQPSFLCPSPLSSQKEKKRKAQDRMKTMTREILLTFLCSFYTSWLLVHELDYPLQAGLTDATNPRLSQTMKHRLQESGPKICEGLVYILSYANIADKNILARRKIKPENPLVYVCGWAGSMTQNSSPFLQSRPFAYYATL